MDSQFFHRHAIAILLATALLLALYAQFSSLDLVIEDYYYDAQHHVFPWKNTWFAKNLMHQYIKNAVMALGIGLLLITVADLIRPWQALSAWHRARLRFVATAAVIIPALISSLKHFSVLHCPLDIKRYNGNEPYIRLFDAAPLHMDPGQCFPAGHASTCLWLAAFCVYWLPHAPKTAIKVFCAGLGAGFFLGWVQQMRGEHFLSHTLWSMWITAFVITLMLALNKQFIRKEIHA